MNLAGNVAKRDRLKIDGAFGGGLVMTFSNGCMWFSSRSVSCFLFPPDMMQRLYVWSVELKHFSKREHCGGENNTVQV